MKYLVKVYESGTAMPHTAEFEIDANDESEAMHLAVVQGHELGYDADDIGQPEVIE